jgi:hypothetical protein
MVLRFSLALSLLLATSAAIAEEGHHPAILNVLEDVAGTQITINGSDFGNRTPEVWLAGQMLIVTQSSDTAITATLPPGIAAGAYLLRVETGHGHESAFFAADLGQVGPIGPQGPVGPQGPMGPQGPLGLTGPQGPQGAVGPQGPIGLTGATGPAGPQGAKGDTGATGPQGATGATGAPGPAGPTGPTGAPGPAGADGRNGAPGGLVFAANMGMPSGGISQLAAVPTGAGSFSEYAGAITTAETVLPVAEACNAGNFTVTAIGATGTSTVTAYLAGTTDPTGNSNEGGIIGCTLTANNGARVSCTSSSVASLSVGMYVNFALINFSTASDWANARVYLSFVCQPPTPAQSAVKTQLAAPAMSSKPMTKLFF